MLLRKLESIATLTTKERSAIESLPASSRTLAAHRDIVRDGDRPSQCCVILSGWAYRYKLLNEGKRQIMSFHLPGDMPDLQSLHLQVMDHGLATLTPCQVVFIPHDALRQLSQHSPEIATLLWRNTLVDAAIFREWMTGIGRRSAYRRIAHLFCEMYLKLQAIGLAEDHCCDFAPKQGDIADALGLSNVHVNRVLQELRGQDLISLQGRKLVIFDWLALTKAGEFDPGYLHLEK